MTKTPHSHHDSSRQATAPAVPVEPVRRRLGSLPRREAITCPPDELIATSWIVADSVPASESCREDR